ncbi:MAG: hypothetical protein KKH68_07690 [Proteobacteria bacterium]|nr:hypothetical protein [Pseudomonadota bacterium]
MDTLAGDISDLVFKRSVKGDLDEFSLDSQMLKILMELDGKKNLASVSRSVNMNMTALKEVLARLNKIQLIEVVEKAVPMLNENFFDFLKNQLSLALGPIAEFLIEDGLHELGTNPDKVPVHRAAELVNLLARQIPRKDRKVTFQQAMAQKIKEGVNPP